MSDVARGAFLPVVDPDGLTHIVVTRTHTTVCGLPAGSMAAAWETSPELVLLCTGCYPD